MPTSESSSSELSPNTPATSDGLNLTRGQREAHLAINKRLTEIEEQVMSDQPIPPSKYLQYAQELNALLAYLTDLEADLHTKIAQIKYEKYVELQNNSAAENYVKSLPIYGHYMKTRAKVSQVEEHIRIAKKMSDRADMEYGNQV